MRTFASIASIFLLLAACADGVEPQLTGEDAVGSVSEPAAAEPPVSPQGPSAEGFAFEDEETRGDALRTFSYSWPSKVSSEATLANQLEQRRVKELARTKREWLAQIDGCAPQGGPCNNNSFALEWKVVADLPRFLSLSNGWSTYTGGAHGIYGRGSLVWDRDAEISFKPAQMFTSIAALERAIGVQACQDLNRERAKRRGMPVPQDGDWPNQCVPLDETVIFIGSSDGGSFDRIGLYYGPYVAASYAEGDFEFTLPVSEAVLEAVKPEYRHAFSIGD